MRKMRVATTESSYSLWITEKKTILDIKEMIEIDFQAYRSLYFDDVDIDIKLNQTFPPG